MDRKLNLWATVRLFVLLLAVLALTAGCGGAQPAPLAQPEEPTATRPAPATATEAPTATAAPSDTPEATAESTATNGSGEEVTYTLPTKGSETAPVTIIEFSDYL
jgi:ABC-type glycerol-3-phosphate transport system substrate-binding protein